MNTDAKKAREIALEMAYRISSLPVNGPAYSALGNGKPSVETVLQGAKKIEEYLTGDSNGLAVNVKAKIEEMSRIIDYCFKNNLPKEHHFFGTGQEIERLTAWTKELGSSCLQTPGTAVSTFYYAGFQFNFIDTDKIATNV